MKEILKWEPVHPPDTEPIWASAEEKQEYLGARKRAQANRAVVASFRGGSPEMAAETTRTND